MDKNNTNYALEVAKAIVFDFITKDTLRKIETIYTFYASGVMALYEQNKITKQECVDLIDIAIILADRKHGL